MPAKSDLGADFETQIPIVGIGASAGGLEALQALVETISPDSGLCYVIVQHLSPDHESILDQLLQTHTRLPVQQIEQSDQIEADTIMLVPPGELLTIEGDIFRLEHTERETRTHTPIDHFLESLAASRGRNAYCVILSGTGSDGTQGLKAVKAAGGFAIVQESSNARFPGMPDNAAATGVVDFVLRAESIAPRLDEIVRHRENFDDDKSKQALHGSIEANLDVIAKILDENQGHDFSQYKPGTLTRRIERRMMLLRIRGVDAFIKLLNESSEERDLLLQDFLIGVTRFFRDPEVFTEVRKKVIGDLFDRDQKSFRVWVPGCSTGEEVYSLAMCFFEEARARGDHRPVQFFGTDIDMAALSHARDGYYSSSSLGLLTERQRNNFFTLEGGRYKVSHQLREACVFAPHNLIQDPPFSRLDLVSCRNLMIYLGVELQRQIIPRFHFSLVKSGYLLLGPSESLAGEDEFFNVVDKPHRLFQKNNEIPVRYSPLADRRPGKTHAPRHVAAKGYQPSPVMEVSRETQAEQAFLRHYAAPFALISDTGKIIYLSEQMAQFVQPAKGVPSTEIETFLARDLRLPVRSVIEEASKSGAEARSENIVVNQDDGTSSLYDVAARPVEGNLGFLLLHVSPVRVEGKAELDGSLNERDIQDRDMLERELVSLRRQLSTTNAEHSASSQELKSSNEELLSMNEELQSSNEELETSREELQSINEELETVNSELSENNTRLIRANSDLKNLFESTDIAVLFLDNQACIRSFTPTTEAFFGVRKRDVGRPISDLSSKIHYEELEEDLNEIERTLQTVEREIQVEKTAETFLLRMRPYRTTDDRLDGYVITFFDITNRKNAEEQLRRNALDLERQYAELETLYDTTPVGLSLIDRDMRWLRINDELAAINGFPKEAHIGKRHEELIPDIEAKILADYKRVFETGEPIKHMEIHGVTPAAPDIKRDWLVDYYPVFSNGEVFAVGTCVREVTEEKMLVRELQSNEARLQLAITRNPLHIAELRHDGKVEWCKGSLPGLPGEEAIGKNISEIMPHDAATCLHKFLSDGETRFDLPVKLEDRTVVYDTCVEPLGDDEDARAYMATFFDLTDRHLMEHQQRLLLDELQHRVKNTLATVIAISRFLSRDSISVENFQERLNSRLIAISRTHDILTAQNWQEASLRELIQMELAPYSSGSKDQVEIFGNDLILTPKEALGIGMALHELVTNAAKYGALSTSEGSVCIEISNTGADWTELPRTIYWKERGGPLIEAAPEEVGFGTILLDKILANDLGGTSDQEFERDGLVCKIAMPAQKESGRVDDA